MRLWLKWVNVLGSLTLRGEVCLLVSFVVFCLSDVLLIALRPLGCFGFAASGIGGVGVVMCVGLLHMG